jgi:hypothetical protein
MKLNFDSCKPKIEEKPREILQQISTAFGDSEVSFLHCFWSMRNLFGRPNLYYRSYELFVENINRFRLFDFEQKGAKDCIKLSECGHSFLNRLRIDKKNNLDANKFALSKEDSIQKTSPIRVISGTL